MDTQVTYPRGVVDGTSQVIKTVPLDKGYGMITRETPFHPLDHTWPPSLVARRMRTCSLPAGAASIPCGGTHVSRTSELGSVRVSLSIRDSELTMRTTVGSLLRSTT
jgi:Ser-tRNA(Ala) deacylase AlaX